MIPLVDQLRGFRGQWVAVDDENVLTAATAATDVITWLREENKHATSVFQVPAEEETLCPS